MALTKVTGHVIKSDTNIISHNINSSGIITAVTFDGNVSGVAVTFTGDSTIGSLGITTNLTVGGNIDVDGQTNLDHVSIAGVTTVTGEIKIPDLSGSSNKISLGTNQNLQIYYDSSSYITNGTAGHLFLKTLNGGSDIRLEANDDIFLLTAAGTKNSIICRDYAQVELYYNNTKRLETTNTGAVVSGILTVTGNMNVEGVLTYQDVTNIDSIGIVTARSDIRGGRNLSVVGIITANQIKFADSNFGASTNQLRFGSSDDMLIYHDGNNSVIKNQTNDLYIESVGSGDDIIIKSADDLLLQVAGAEDGIKIIGDGAVELYHNGIKQIETASSGVLLPDMSTNKGRLAFGDLGTRIEGGAGAGADDGIHFMTNSVARWQMNPDGDLIPNTAGAVDIGSASKEIGDVYLADGKSVYLGSGQDVRMLYDSTGSASFSIDSSAGYLYINSDAVRLNSKTSSWNYLRADKSDGVLKLYKSNSEKLATSDTGITVTGEVAASQDYPNFRPTLDFNFAAEKKLDPRITYQRTGPASFTDKFGKVVLVGDNAPRFDHNPTTRESLGILIEEERTNYAVYSTKVSNEYGSYYNMINGAVLVNNAGVAPDGTNTATKMYPASSGSARGIEDIYTLPSTGEYTTSVYVKAAGHTGWIALYSVDGGTRAYFNPTTGAAGQPGTYSSTPPAGKYGIEDAGNGWYRCHLTINLTSTGGAEYFYLYFGDTDGSVSVTHSGTNGILMWGLQVEKGDFSTSYIPTNGTTATRGADQTYIDGDDFLDFYNQLEGTVISSHSILPNIPSNHNLYTYQIAPTGATAYAPLRILDKNSSIANSIAVASVYNNGYSFLTLDTGNPVTVAGRKYVIAVSIKKDDYDAVFDGGDLLSDSSGDLYTADHISIGYYKPSPQAYLNGHIQRLIYYPTKLTNNQLKTITS